MSSGGVSEEERQTDTPDELPIWNETMRCKRCWGKLKLRNDGWRRCGKGCSEVMGFEMRATMHQEKKLINKNISKPKSISTFKTKPRPTWKAENAA